MLAANVARILAPLAAQPLLGNNPSTAAGLLRLLAAFIEAATVSDAVATVLQHCEEPIQGLQVALPGCPLLLGTLHTQHDQGLVSR